MNRQIISLLLLSSVFLAGCSLETESTVETDVTTDNVTIEETISTKPVIASPTEGSTVEGPGITLQGKAAANSEIWAYINYTEEDMACISSNSYANGGASMVDAEGNFEFGLAEPCSEEITVFVSVVAQGADEQGECRDESMISEPVTFTKSGELPGVCNQ